MEHSYSWCRRNSEPAFRSLRRSLDQAARNAVRAEREMGRGFNVFPARPAREKAGIGSNSNRIVMPRSPFEIEMEN